MRQQRRETNRAVKNHARSMEVGVSLPSRLLVKSRTGIDRGARRQCSVGQGHPVALELVSQDRNVRVTLEHLIELGDVVVVVVGEQYVGERQLPTAEVVEQRPDRTAGVDHHRVPAWLVRDDVRVRQEVVVHGALNDQCGQRTR